MDNAKRLIRSAANDLRRGLGEPDFFEFVRRLDNTAPEMPRTGCAKHASEEPLRFGSEPYLRFPETTFAHILPGGAPEGRALLLLYAFGLFGVNGPMPLEITGLVFQRSKNELDRSLQRFADIVHHRMIALFYRAWAVNEEAVQFDRPGDDLAGQAILALSGLPAKEEALGLPPYAGRAFARFLGRAPRTADGLGRILTRFAGRPVRIADTIESDFDIPAEYRCRLGRRGVAELGVSAQIGEHSPSRSRLFRIEIGPADFGEAQVFLPGTRGFDELVRLTQFYLERPCDFALRLRIRTDSIPQKPLGGAALGRNLWLGNPRAAEDVPGETRIDLTASNRAVAPSTFHSGVNS